MKLPPPKKSQPAMPRRHVLGFFFLLLFPFGDFLDYSRIDRGFCVCCLVRQSSCTEWRHTIRFLLCSACSLLKSRGGGVLVDTKCLGGCSLVHRSWLLSTNSNQKKPNVFCQISAESWMPTPALVFGLLPEDWVKICNTSCK